MTVDPVRMAGPIEGASAAPGLSDKVIEECAERAFLASRAGRYALKAFGEIPEEHQEFWRSLVRMVLARALAGRSVIELPEPTLLNDGDYVWHLGTEFDTTHTVGAYVDGEGGVYVDACDTVGELSFRSVAAARAFFTAGLAACEQADRMSERSVAAPTAKVISS